jgi:hypothetical protein
MNKIEYKKNTFHFQYMEHKKWGLEELTLAHMEKIQWNNKMTERNLTYHINTPSPSWGKVRTSPTIVHLWSSHLPPLQKHQIP